MKTIKGRPVCETGWDARGRAHIRHPLEAGVTLCGRKLEQAGKPNGKSCGGCAERAEEGNAILRGIPLYN